MDKQTYVEKLESLKTTPQTTLEQVRVNKKVERQLRKFWETKATKFIVKENNLDWEQVSYGHDIRFVYDMKPTGTIKMQVWFQPSGWGDFGAFGQPDVLEAEYVVNKKFLLQ